MDQTTLPKGPPLTVSPDTAIQAGVPPGSAHVKAAAEPRAEKQPKSLFVRILEPLASLKITVTLFSLSLVLVFWGTLAQVDNGVWTVVQQYFRSAFVLVPLKVILFNSVDNTDIVLPYPGGWLIGTALLINLLAAHAIRFRLAWNRAGILLIHAGLIILMLGELVAGLFQVEGNMVIQVSQTVSAVINGGKTELAVIHTLDPKKDEIVTVPAARLKDGSVIDDENLPFRMEVLEYMVNSDLLNVKEGERNQATKGFGRINVAKKLPEVAGVNMNQTHDAASAYVKLTSRDGREMGTWLFSVLFEQPQWIKVEGKEYQVSLRFKQRARGFTFHLTKFEHKKFPGTEKPRDFHSYIHLSDPAEGVERDVEIYMNAPLRYAGETFYQSSWTTDPRTGVANGTILQVVHNPGWLMPYISCVVVGVGMLLHFGLTLYRFIDRRIVR